MSTIKEVASAFAHGRSARCHNAHTDGQTYTLHRTVIARKLPDGKIRFTFGGYFTPTTANHLKHVLLALNRRFVVWPSYAAARDGRIPDTWES